MSAAASDTDDLAIGRHVSFRKTLTVAEQAMFTGISGNLGPLYVDRVRARASGAEDMIAFELVIGALASTCIARLCGPAWRIAKLDLAFAAAVPVGTTVEASAEITAVESGRVAIRIGCGVADTAVMTGSAELARV